MRSGSRRATSSWYFSGYPNGSGQVAQELFPSSYDFAARWFGNDPVQSAVTISANTTVTFQQACNAEPPVSTGSGLSGQDSAIWVRPAARSSGTSQNTNGSGQVAQDLLAGSYDVQFRWLGTYQTSSAVAVNGATAITVNAAALNITARKTSDNGGLGCRCVCDHGRRQLLRRVHRRQRPVPAQVLVGTVNVQGTKSPITGTDDNVVVPSGGTSATGDARLTGELAAG